MTTQRRLSNYILGCVIVLGWSGASLTSAATVAHWRFEPGNLTVDSSGNGHTLTNSGVTSSGDLAPTAYLSAGSANFNGASAMVTAANLDLSSYSTLTVEWFMKTNTGATTVVWEHSANTNSFNGAISTYLNDGPFVFSPNNYANGYYRKSTASVSDDIWRHYAMTVDRSLTDANRLQLYIDGNLTGTAALGGADTAFLNDLFYLGARGGSAFFFTGLLDEFRISDELLSPSEFLNVPPVPEPSTLALLGLGAIGLAIKSRRRRTAA